MLIAEIVACVALLATAVGFSFLAVMATGGDSAFATRSSWVYAPWLLALALTLAAIVLTAWGKVVPSAVLIVASITAYTVTWRCWGLFEPLPSDP